MRSGHLGNMLKIGTICCLITLTFAVEGVIDSHTTDELSEELKLKFKQLTRDLEELIQLINQDLDGKLLYRSSSWLDDSSKKLEQLVYQLDNAYEDPEDSDVEVEIIEITELEPEESEIDNEVENEIYGTELLNSPTDLVGELEPRYNNSLADAKAKVGNKAAAGKGAKGANGLKKNSKTKLSAGNSKNKNAAKKKLSANKKNQNKKTKLSTKRKIIKKTKLSSAKSKKIANSKKTNLSASQTKLAMKKLSAKEAKNICNSLNVNKNNKNRGGSLREVGGGSDEETPKNSVANTLQQLTEAFNKLQSAISQVSRGSNPVTVPSAGSQPSVPSVVQPSELGPSVGSGPADQSTLSPQVASNLVSVLSRVAAASVSTTSNPLDPIVKAAISVQGQAANALRGILPGAGVA